MKIRADMDNILYAVGKYQTMPLIDLVKMLVEKDGRPVGRIESDAGITSNGLYYLMRAKGQALKSGSLYTIIVVLLHLGYDLTISKRQEP